MVKQGMALLAKLRPGNGDPRYREIRSVLVGRYEEHEDGRLRARSRGDFRPRWGSLGIEDGAELPVLFGVKKTSRLYELDPDEAWKALGRTYLVLCDMGRGFLIREEPELTVFYCRFYLTPPAVVITETVDEGLRLTAYSGGGPTGLLARHHALNRVERESDLTRPESGLDRFMAGIKNKSVKQEDPERGEKDEAEDISGGE